MEENILLEKSYKFSIRIVKLFQHLSKNKVDYSLTRQLLRAGTSIGANIEEANKSESPNDFVHKLSIAQKEMYETEYWLRLLRDSEILEQKLAESMIEDCVILKKIVSKSIINSKKSNEKSKNIK